MSDPIRPITVRDGIIFFFFLMSLKAISPPLFLCPLIQLQVWAEDKCPTFMNEPANKKRVGVDLQLQPHDNTCQSHTLIPTSHLCTCI